MVPSVSTVRSTRALFPLLAALIVAAVCVSLFIGFFAVRAYLNPFPRISMRLEGGWMIAPDETIGYVPRPGSAVLRLHLDTGVRFRIYTDHRGARVDAPGQETRPHVNIVTVGGSYSHGHGVENEETFTSRLGRALGVPVANLAFPSFGTVQSAVLLERNLDLEPEIVIYGFIADHLRRNLSPCAPSYSPYCLPVAFVGFDVEGQPFLEPPRIDYFTPEQNQEFYEQVLMRERFGWRDVLWRMRVDLFRLRESSRIAYESDPAKMGAALGFLIDRMLAAVKRTESRLIILHIPTPLAPPFAAAPAVLAETLSTRDVELLDLAPRFEQLAAEGTLGELMVAQEDGHPSPHAHELIATELERWIRTREEIPSR